VRSVDDAGGRVVFVGLLIQLAGVVVLFGSVLSYGVVSGHQIAAVTFWACVLVLAYIYVGYPLLLTLIRLFAKRSLHRADITPRVCVFIPANDEEAVIETKLRNTLALDYPSDRLEIVVASDGSVDDTNKIVRRFAPRVRLVEFFPRRGKMATISEAIQSVDSEIVVFSDANTFLDVAAVRALVASFADHHVGAVSGDVRLLGERAALGRAEDLYYRYERWVQQAESDIGSMIGADGALYAIRRELFVAPPADTILDDMAIPMSVIRARRRVVFEATAVGFEEGSKTATEEFYRKSRVIAGAVQFLARRDSAVPLAMPQVILSLVSHKALRWLSPVFGTCTFVSALALADGAPHYAVAALGQGALLAVGIAGCAPFLRRLSPVAMAHYFCLIQAAAAIGFVRGLTGRQSVLWRRFERPRSDAPLAYTK
jgi:poly-beta-1,6-N-acetyl-D-glucosamine synthase